MNREHKKTERELLEVFRACYEGFPKARIKAYESPDFQLIINRHKTIGLEVVRYVAKLDNAIEEKHIHFDSNLLKALIEKKDERSSGYKRMRYHELWLLIVSGSSQYEPLILHPDSIDWSVFRSEVFDKVFYLDMRRKDFFKLQ